MFYCDECAEKRGWPTNALIKSLGACELCKRKRVCNDINSKFLPPTVTKGDIEELIYMIDDNYKAPEGKLSLAIEWVKDVFGVKVVE